MIPPGTAAAIADRYPAMLGPVLQAAAGDESATAAVLDFLAERGETLIPPMEVGKCYLIETPQWYYTGRVVELGTAWVVLEDAAQIHWMSDFPTALAAGTFASGSEVSPVPKGQLVRLPAHWIGPVFDWPHSLPRTRTHKQVSR
jgi:hypothetical protein